MMKLLLKIYAILLLAEIAAALTEGDVRLVRQPNFTAPIAGRLDIYLKGKWSTFCGISESGMETVCRQLGFSEMWKYGNYSQANHSLIPRASEDMPIAIAGTNCPTAGYDHILRCSYSTDTSHCTHDQDIYVWCWPMIYSYRTRVRLHSDISLSRNVTQSSSSGALEIFLEDKWGDVCYTPKVNKQAADLVCRQMGYTNAKTYNITSKKSSTLTWLNGIHCGRSAQCGNPTNCLSSCFKYPDSTVKDNICSGGYLYIQCVFNASKASTALAGNEITCSSLITCTYSEVSIPVVVVVVVVVLIIIAIVSCIITVVVCFAVPSCLFARMKKRKGYESAN